METFALLLLTPMAIVLLAGMRRVPEDTACTVHRFGRYARTLTPGLRWTIPFVEHIAHRVRLVGHEVSLSQQPATDATAQGAVYYQILEPQRAGDALDEVDALVQREAREGLATLLLGVAANDSVMLASQLKTELNQRLAALGLRVTRCKLELTEAA